jgi:hypothetical protein
MDWRAMWGKQAEPIDFGRLIRATVNQIDQQSVSYIVAINDVQTAIEIIRRKVGLDSNIEDLGRVSDALLNYLHLRDGETRALEQSSLMRQLRLKCPPARAEWRAGPMCRVAPTNPQAPLHMDNETWQFTMVFVV